MLGPSGCGKTTTLRMIGGFEETTAGTIYLGDADVTDLPPFKRDVNTVFQNYALFPHLTVYENVAFGLRRRKVAGRRDPQPGRRDARARRAAGLRAPQAEPALRRPAAARGAGPRAHQPPAGPAPRRAARRARPEAAQADADRAEADPDRGRHHVHLRDPRPGRGDDDVRPHRRHARRHGSSSSARPRSSTSARRPISWPASWASEPPRRRGGRATATVWSAIRLPRRDRAPRAVGDR